MDDTIHPSLHPNPPPPAGEGGIGAPQLNNPAPQGFAANRMAHGGKTLYGARVGILMLETRFPRIPGDMGHAATWPFPVLYKVVRGATAERVTTARANDRSTGLLDAFLAAGAELVADGDAGLRHCCRT